MRFGLFCKSFRDDLDRFEVLYQSVLEFNAEQLPFVVSVPSDDRPLFEQRFGGQGFELVSDEQVVGSADHQNWRFQQLVKLGAYKLDFADAWMVVDSDAYFIRRFGKSDFVDPGGDVAMPASRSLHLYTPESTELLAYIRGQATLSPVTREELTSFKTAPENLGTIRRVSGLWDRVTKPSASACLARISRVFQRSGPYLNFMPGAIWTRGSLESMNSQFLEPRRLDTARLIEHAPWEAVWVGEWELSRGAPQRFPMEPLLCHFDSDSAIEHARAQGVTASQLAERYLGVILAARHQNILRF